MSRADLWDQHMVGMDTVCSVNAAEFARACRSIQPMMGTSDYEDIYGVQLFRRGDDLYLCATNRMASAASLVMSVEYEQNVESDWTCFVDGDSIKRIAQMWGNKRFAEHLLIISISRSDSTDTDTRRVLHLRCTDDTTSALEFQLTTGAECIRTIFLKLCSRDNYDSLNGVLAAADLVRCAKLARSPLDEVMLFGSLTSQRVFVEIGEHSRASFPSVGGYTGVGEFEPAASDEVDDVEPHAPMFEIVPQED